VRYAVGLAVEEMESQLLLYAEMQALVSMSCDCLGLPMYIIYMETVVCRVPWYSFIHSFIHIEHLYSAPSRKPTQRRSELQCG